MQGSANLFSFVPLIVLFAIFYFLVIRPQQNQIKKHKEMLSALKKGDEIVTNGGLIGEIVKVEENFIKVKLNDEGVTVKISRDFIAKKTNEQ